MCEACKAMVQKRLLPPPSPTLWQQKQTLPLKVFFLILTLLTGISATAFPQVAGGSFLHSECPKRELRAVWLTTLSGLDWPRTKATSPSTIEKQKRELCTLLDEMKQANINTILMQTRIRGSLIYPSRLEPWDACLTGTYDRNPGYDPLQYAIEQTHLRGMELHAWVVTIPAFKIATAQRMGKKSLLHTHPELLVKHNDQYYLDPGMPGTADYLSTILSDFIDRYDIDGIHFDYIRYPENATSFADGKTYKKYGHGKPKSEWRRDNITAIVRRLYNEVKQRKPWVKMSSSPVGKYRDTRRYSSRGWNAFDAVHQDAQGWLREGIQDALFPMMYFTGDHFYPFAVDWQEGAYGRPVCPGLGIYFLHPSEKNWDLSVITQELHYLRQEGLAGQAYFRARFLTDQDAKGLYAYLRNHFYPEPALPPCYPWLDSIPPSMPERFTLTPEAGNMALLAWASCTDNLSASVRYNVYASRQFPVDISNPENLVATLLPNPEYHYNNLYAQLYGIHLAVTAIDRCGNEGPAAQLSIPGASASAAPTRIPLTPTGRPVRGRE